MTASAHSQSHDRFATTRWSVVLHLAATDPKDAGQALTELVQRYWYPVYAYVRRCGHAADDARAIAGCFLERLMHDFRVGTARPPQGHFRRYLLEQLNAFLAGDWRQCVQQAARELTPPSDLETRNARDNAHTTSPEQAYHHSFALEVMLRAITRLRGEAEETGHLAMFEALLVYFAREPHAGEIESLAARLQTRPLALIVALRRLRQRFRELVERELADTVTSAADLATEQAALLAIRQQMRSAS